jgi:hypothetical protein
VPWQAWELNNAVIGATAGHPLLRHLVFAISTGSSCCCVPPLSCGPIAAPLHALAPGTALGTIAASGPGLFTRVVMSHVVQAGATLPPLPAPLLAELAACAPPVVAAAADAVEASTCAPSVEAVATARLGAEAAATAVLPECGLVGHTGPVGGAALWAPTVLAAAQVPPKAGSTAGHDLAPRGLGLGPAVLGEERGGPRLAPAPPQLGVGLGVRLLPPAAFYPVPNTLDCPPPRFSCDDAALVEYLAWAAGVRDGSHAVGAKEAEGVVEGEGARGGRCSPGSAEGPPADVETHLGPLVAAATTGSPTTLAVHFWAKSWTRKAAVVCPLP